MSRTDAHAPYWTRAVWYEPVHDLYCRFYLNRSWQRRTPEYPCNLPQRPVRHAGRRTRVYVPLCTWEPVEPPWPYSMRAAKVYGAGVPKWFNDHRWANPERVRERDHLGEMVKEYRALGELEDGDFPNWQHRHLGRWDWY